MLTQEAAKLDRRNMFWMTLEGSLFWTGLAFCEASTVTSLFLERTTGSAALAGLVLTLMNLMPTLGQFIFGMFIHRVRVPHKTMANLALITRPLTLIVLPFLFSGNMGPVSGILFLVMYGLIMFGDGFVGLLWTEVGFRTLAHEKRGMVSSIQQIVAGFAGLGVGTLIRLIFGTSWPEGIQYGVIFASATLFFVLDAIAFRGIRDVPDFEPRLEEPVPSFSHYLGGFVTMWKESPAARRIALARILYMLGMVSSPLIILFAPSAGIPENLQLFMIYMPVVGQFAGGAFWTWICARFSYSAVMRISQIVNMLAAVLCCVVWILSPGAILSFVMLSLAMVLISANNSAVLGYKNAILDAEHGNNMARHYILQALLVAPFTLGTTAAGALADAAGYGSVFIVTLAAGLTGTVFASLFLGKASETPREKL